MLAQVSQCDAKTSWGKTCTNGCLLGCKKAKSAGKTCCNRRMGEEQCAAETAADGTTAATYCGDPSPPQQDLEETMLAQVSQCDAKTSWGRTCTNGCLLGCKKAKSAGKTCCNRRIGEEQCAAETAADGTTA